MTDFCKHTHYSEEDTHFVEEKLISEYLISLILFQSFTSLIMGSSLCIRQECHAFSGFIVLGLAFLLSQNPYVRNAPSCYRPIIGRGT